MGTPSSYLTKDCHPPYYQITLRHSSPLRRNSRRSGENPQMAVGDVVLIQNDSTKRVLWKLAIMKELIAGSDDKIRAAVVQVADSGNCSRGVSRIYLQSRWNQTLMHCRNLRVQFSLNKETILLMLTDLVNVRRFMENYYEDWGCDTELFRIWTFFCSLVYFKS